MKTSSNARKLIFSCLPWLMALVMALIAGQAQASGGEIKVYMGESTTLNLDYKFSDLALGDPSVADFVVRQNSTIGSEVLINGKKVGVTNLIVWNQKGQKAAEYTIKVLVRDLSKLKAQLRALLKGIKGISVKQVGDKILVEGQVLLVTDLYRVKTLVGDNPQVVTLISMSPIALKVLSEKITESLAQNGVRAFPVGQKIALKGVVFSPEASKHLEQQARLFYPYIENLIMVRESKLRPGQGEMIQVAGHFMEVNNSAIDSWGVNWSPGSTSSLTAEQGFGSAAGFTGAVVGTLTNLLPKFSRAKEKGYARVLESSSVSVRSGENARLHSGGEMGVPVAQPNGGTTIEWKKHGVFLNVLPISQGDDVSMQIEIKVSMPTGTSPGGFINFKQSEISTVQVCRSGDSIVLGGLISNRDTTVFDALPDGADGALFQLYHSDDFRRQRSQFVIFVTPLVLADGAKQAHQELRQSVGEAFDAYKEERR